MGHAVVIGATGQIGRAAVQVLAEHGWTVTAGSRGGGRAADWPAGVRAVRVDREDDAALAAAIGAGCDVLVDVVAYGPEHARQLLALADRVGSAVVMSSGAVYADRAGRSFDTQQEPDGFPRYPVPIPETQPTVAPGGRSYGSRKVALEQELLAAGDRLPTTLLRAGAVHGPHGSAPRELYFVKRNLDGRRVRVLAHGGANLFHPVSVHNLAELIRLAAARPGSRVLNAGDPQVPTVQEIGAAIDAVMGVSTETVLVPGAPPPSGVGASPWCVPHPIVFATRVADDALGYRPVVTYAQTLPETVAWLTERLAGRDWRTAFPAMVEAYAPLVPLFDYAAEDAWLAARAS